ncbi:MAG: hypothetical protein WBZ42_09140 [Halobacteriota archaeon]
MFITDSSERENKFVLCLSKHVEEDDTRLVERGELYALAKAIGFSEREVYRYSMDLDLLGYLKARPILGGAIASVSLTARGVEYAKQLRDHEKSL